MGWNARSRWSGTAAHDGWNAHRTKSGARYYRGGIVDSSANVVRFLALGSTGELVTDSNATICGVFTGRVEFKNRVGGVTMAAQVVGLFDLPVNQRATK
jgi:hypothetical protein